MPTCSGRGSLGGLKCSVIVMDRLARVDVGVSLKQYKQPKPSGTIAPQRGEFIVADMQRYLQHCCVHLQVDLSEKKECYLRVAGSMKKGSSHAAVIEALAGHFKVMITWVGDEAPDAEPWLGCIISYQHRIMLQC